MSSWAIDRLVMEVSDLIAYRMSEGWRSELVAEEVIATVLFTLKISEAQAAALIESRATVVENPTEFLKRIERLNNILRKEQIASSKPRNDNRE